MENQNQKKKNSYPSLPSNYVTLAQLQQRWLNQQTQNQEKQQPQQQHEAEEEPIAVAVNETAADDSVANRREPEACAGIGGETADLDRKVAESSKKKRKAWNRNRRRKPNVEEQKGAIGEGSEAAIRSEVNEEKGVDSVKVEEEEGEREFGGSSVNTVKGKQNGRVRRVEQKGVSVGGSRTAIGMVWSEKKRVDSVKMEENVEQKFRVLTVVKKNQKGRMRRVNRVEQNGARASEGGSKTTIGSELSEKKSVDLVKLEERVEQKFGGLTVKGNQNGGMRRMNVVEQKGESEGGSKTMIGSELNEKKSVDLVKFEEKTEQKFGGLAVKTNQNRGMRRMNKVEQKGESEGGSKTVIGSELSEKKSVDLVKFEEKTEQKFGGLAVKTNQNGGMRRMNKVEQKGESEGGSKTMIGSELSEKKSVDLVKFEEKTEQKFGGLAVKTNQNGGMRRMNKVEQKGESEGGSKTTIGSHLNEKKIVDLVKFEEKVEQKFGDFSVKGNQNGGMRRMNKVEQKAANGGLKNAIGSDLNEKRSVDLVKVEEKAEQKFGGFSVNSVKGNHNGRMRRMNHNGFRHYDSQGNGHGNGYRRHGSFNGQHSNAQRGKSDKMVWVRKDDVGAGAVDGGEIESET